MKKIITILLTIILVLSLAACGSANTESSSETKQATEAPQTNKIANDNSTSVAGKTLIVYFSWSNNTATMANYIHDKIGGDIERIEPTEAYPEDYNDTADKAKTERDNDERPAFQTFQYNPEDYDTIFIGYPIWWYELPMVMRTFFDAYVFSGKTIIPFNTHEGSGDGGTYSQIQKLEPDANVKEGLPIRGGDIENVDSNNKVISWLSNLGY